MAKNSVENWISVTLSSYSWAPILVFGIHIISVTLFRMYKIALFTNAWENARKVYIHRYHLDKITSEMIVSAETGLKKPDTKFYELALGRLGAIASETLFIDDTHENIKAAKEIGIHSVQFTTTEQAIEDINEYLAG